MNRNGTHPNPITFQYKEKKGGFPQNMQPRVGKTNGHRTEGGAIYLRRDSNGYMMTTGMVAKTCGVAPRTVTKWCDGGKLRSYRVPGSLARRVYAHDLIKMMRDHGWTLPDGLLALVEGAPELIVFGGSPATVLRAVRDYRETKRFAVKLIDDVFDLGLYAADVNRFGVLVLGPNVTAKDASSVAGKLYNRWTCIRSYAPDQPPGENFEQDFPEDRVDDLFAAVEYFLTHVKE